MGISPFLVFLVAERLLLLVAVHEVRRPEGRFFVSGSNTVRFYVSLWVLLCCGLLTWGCRGKPWRAAGEGSPL